MQKYLIWQIQWCCGKSKKATGRLTNVAVRTVALETRVAVTKVSMWIAESVLNTLLAVMVVYVAARSRRKT